jgi:hypothetical protein
LAWLNSGYLSGEPDQAAMPQLRKDLIVKTGTASVLNFAPRRRPNN